MTDRSLTYPGKMRDHGGDLSGLERLEPGWHVWAATRSRAAGVASAQWDEIVGALDGDVTQTSGWVEYALATDYERALLVAGVDADGAPRAAAAGFISAPKWPLHGFRSIRFAAPPAVGSDLELLPHAVSACEGAARAHGCHSVEVLGVEQQEGGTPPGFSGYRTKGRLEYVVDLTRGKEELWRGLAPDQQRNVKLARKHKVYVARAAPLTSMRVLRALQVEVSKRHASRGDGFGLRPVEAYDALGKALMERNYARVYCALVDDEVVMAALCTTFGRRARGIYNGASERGLEVRATTAVIWLAMTDLARDGFTELSFGMEDPGVQEPTSPAHTLHKFKLRLGAELRDIAEASKLLRPTRARVYGALRRTRSSVWTPIVRRFAARAGGVG